MERRRPQHRHQHQQPAEVPRHGDVQRRHGRDSGLRADVGEHEGAVRHRRRAHPSRSRSTSTPTARRRSRSGDVDIGALAGADLPGEVARAAFRACARSSSRTSRGGSPATATSPARSTCSRGGPSDLDRHVRERAGRRSTTTGSRALRLAALDAARLRGHERRRRSSSAATRGSVYCDRAARRADQADAPLRRDADRASTSRASPTSSSSPGCASPGAPSRHNVLEWPLGPLRRASRRRAAGRRRRRRASTPMTASLAAARAADADHARHEWGPFAPLPLPAHLPIAGELTYRFGPDDVDDRRRALRDRAARTSRSSGTTAWGDAVAAAVPRDEQRLAGKRSGARRHHDRLRIADRRRCRSAAAASSTAR